MRPLPSRRVVFNPAQGLPKAALCPSNIRHPAARSGVHHQSIPDADIRSVSAQLPNHRSLCMRGCRHPWALLTTVLIGTGCSSDRSYNLGDGYTLVAEGGRTSFVIGSGQDAVEVPYGVSSFAFDDKFILLEQRPRETDDIMFRPVQYPHGRDSTYYWLIVKKNDSLIGPLLRNRFRLKRSEMGVPEQLELMPLGLRQSVGQKSSQIIEQR